SYTGEDTAELHLHGGRAVIEGVAAALAAQGLRPAEPGEFTRRAFLNGCMDLVEAEAVHDLIAAETEAQRRQALRQLEGALGSLYHGWAGALRGLLAQQEALIDFPDEDLPPEVEAEMLAALRRLRGAIAAHLDDSHRGEKLREGLCFAIAGAPNVGKSSLINALAERDVAIVSATPGTTRDALETRVVLGGVPVTLVDTAGLRETADAVEAEGVRRARARAASADLVIAVVEAGGSPPVADAGRRLLVANKADLGAPGPDGALRVSALTGAGLDALRDRLASEARALTEGEGPPPLTRARHRVALQTALERLEAAEAADLAELRGEDLRLALNALGRITGRIGVEDILDTLFSQFCIGK
ncbi:MAG: tRNA uridine-5-carboxymethylaminomethyl(34) synthesis GTPase MnmE, partial [Acetobacteraceae bacterium]|nr:tRNA uridine-5-carboxymethylaminomethyl(34) synthesis GTPase MnmE [Acetobacteraceae bacterium]